MTAPMVPAAPGAVVDHDRLAELPRSIAGIERARHDVGGAARREADDQPHRF